MSAMHRSSRNFTNTATILTSESWRQLRQNRSSTAAASTDQCLSIIKPCPKKEASLPEKTYRTRRRPAAAATAPEARAPSSWACEWAWLVRSANRKYPIAEKKKAAFTVVVSSGPICGVAPGKSACPNGVGWPRRMKAPWVSKELPTRARVRGGPGRRGFDKSLRSSEEEPGVHDTSARPFLHTLVVRRVVVVVRGWAGRAE